MMRAGRKAPRLLLVALVGLLPLLASHCSVFKKQQQLGVRALTPDESAKMEETRDPWGGKPPRNSLERQTLSEDRLQALGEMALQSRDYETSLVNFLQILKNNPQRYDLRYKVGVIFLMTGQFAAARQELAQVLVQKPDMVQAHEALGLVHLEEKQYSQAIEEFQSVLAQDPTRAKTQHLLGMAYLEAGQTEKALAEMKKATLLDPRQVSSLIALGQAYNQKKDYRNALTYLKKAQALAPEDKKVNYHLGMALAGQKEYPQALEAFLKAGDEAQAYNNIGVHYFVEGRYEDAAKCFQRAIELRPTLYQEAKGNLQRALEKLHQTKPDGS